jgi:transposase
LSVLGLFSRVVRDDHFRVVPPRRRASARCSISGERSFPVSRRKSKLADAIRYATARRRSLERFLDDGRIDTDSNIVERAIRPQSITRKNALFAGSDGGGRTWATIASLLQTARMNHVDPFAWLKLTLERLADGWPNSRIDELMPWNALPS